MSTKQDILQQLECHRDEPMSGAALAENLGVSRTAVWKAINSLRSDGYQIEASTNKGYTLLESNDILSKASIRPLLTRDIDLQVFETVDSTNKVAAALALDNAPHGTTVVSGEQTAGRGRLGRSFYSPKDSGVYLSIISEPNYDLSKAVLITAAAAVATAKAIDEITGKQSQIKWVNDIYLDDKKVSGILTEAISDFETGHIHRIVTGIGVNCTTEHFPEAAGKYAGSLGGSPSRSKLAAAIINHFLDILDHLEERTFIDEYRKRSYVIGKDIHVFPTMDVDPIPAKAIDIDRDGGLVIEHEDGTQETLSTGEISIRLR